MKRSNSWRLAMLLTLIALVVAACGETTDPGTTTTTAADPGGGPTTTAGSPGTTAAPEGDNLTLWVYDDGRTEVLTQLGEEFAEEYGVGVTVEVVDLGELRNQMLLGASGAGPDLAIIPHDNLGAMVENGVVKSIDLGDKADQYLSNSVEGFTYNGELFGLPLAIENIGFFYNTDLVETPPATWDEVRTMGEALVDSGDAQYIIGLPDLTYNSYPVYTSFGGYIFGQDESGSFVAQDIGMNNDGMVAGMTWIGDLAEDGLIPENVDWEASHVLFEEGAIPFLMTGPWAINRIDEAGVPYAVGPFPAATAGGEPGYPFLGVQGLIINANSDQLLLAETFALEKIATEESMRAIFEAEPRPSAWISVFELATDPAAQGFNAAGVSAVPMPSIPAMGFVWDAWVNAGTLVMTGELSPTEALDDAVTQVETQIEQSG